MRRSQKLIIPLSSRCMKRTFFAIKILHSTLSHTPFSFEFRASQVYKDKLLQFMIWFHILSIQPFLNLLWKAPATFFKKIIDISYRFAGQMFSVKSTLILC